MEMTLQAQVDRLKADIKKKQQLVEQYERLLAQQTSTPIVREDVEYG